MNWIRKHIYWIAGLAVGGMVLWLITSAVTLQSVQPESAGTMFGRSVPANDYLRSLEAVTHQAVLSYGDRFRQSVSMQELEDQAWERLLFLNEARRKGIKVSDQEVVEELRNSPMFRNDNGEFDGRGYQVVMQYTLGTTPRVFEEETRQNLMIQKLIQQALGSSSVTEEELKRRFQEREGAIRLDYAVFPDLALAREAADACRALPQQLEKLAKQADSNVEETDFFKRTDTVPGLDNAALIFSNVTELQPGQAGGPFKTGPGWAVVRLKDRRPPDEKDFEQAKAAIEEELLSQKKLNNYLAWYQELLTRAKPQRKLRNAWPPAA